MEALGQVGGTTMPSKIRAALFFWCGSNASTSSWLQDGCCIMAAFPRGIGREQRAKVIMETPVLPHQTSSYLSLINTGLNDEPDFKMVSGKKYFLTGNIAFLIILGFS